MSFHAYSVDFTKIIFITAYSWCQEKPQILQLVSRKTSSISLFCHFTFFKHVLKVPNQHCVL
uniref:Uncharacterized protein n=1 Tax=Anguilla anguilla TaxID=7936 RepID=A0A0E9WTC4_ANGAN